jgi:predicted amidohydrolase YtcJ
VKTRNVLRCVLAMTLGMMSASQSHSQPKSDPARAPDLVADLVVLNAAVVTEDAQLPSAQALAVSGDHFVYVGADAGARALVGKGTRVIDLKGRSVLPGLIDSHIHPSLGEWYWYQLCQVGGYTTSEYYKRLADCARASKHDWVVAFGWYSTDNPKVDEITLAKLDEIVPDRKLVVIARDGHNLWLNSKALQAFNITKDSVDPRGGKIGRDPKTGLPNGVLYDAATNPVLAVLRRNSPYAVDNLAIYRQVIPYLNSLGLTSILDALADDDMERAYHALDAEGGLTMHVSMAFRINPDDYRTAIPRIASKRASQTAHTRVDYVKVFGDGNLEDGLADMLQPYRLEQPSFDGYFTQEQMNEIVHLAEQNRISIYVHCIGDRCTNKVLNAVALARKTSPCDWCRHTITHLSWVAPSDMPRFKQLGVLANIQEGWLAPRVFGGPPGYNYLQAAVPQIGKAIAERMYPFRDLRDAGAHIAGSSDWFFTDENPWHNIESGATSKDPGEASEEPMLPNQTLPVGFLLQARTINAAYQLRIEHERGSIEVGKKADFIVVDRNILTEPVDRIHDTKVLMTFFEGREVTRH